MKPISRRGFTLGASAAAATMVSTRRARAAAPIEMRQFHNQTEGTPLDKRLKEMWAAVEKETGGKIRVKTYAGNDNVPGGDPQARDMLISGELEFYTLMGGILGEVVPIADIQGCRSRSATIRKSMPPWTAISAIFCSRRL